jgi:hypothetical protein
MQSPKTLEEKRDRLIRNIRINEKDVEKRSGYVDGILDMYNEAKREDKCVSSV